MVKCAGRNNDIDKMVYNIWTLNGKIIELVGDKMSEMGKSTYQSTDISIGGLISASIGT